jgi:hypothetical protein
VLCLTFHADAATITVKPGDSYTKIESAKPGDTVLIEPGTYKFRVMLEKKGTAASPIVIKAKDPNNRPVWDLKGKNVSQWPGSYTGGDRGRGAWQVKGSHYIIESIVFRNCQDSESAGLRAPGAKALTVRDCLFENNTNGITGSVEGFLIEFCEFNDNGKTGGGNPSHNLYVYGGTLTLRYSYLHDSKEGQNFHIRARQSTIEYSWMTRAASYPGDIMSCETLCGGSGSQAITQKMTLRGNVIVQGNTGNLSGIVTLYDDSGSGSGDGTGQVSKMELTMIGNTVIGASVSSGQMQQLVKMRNDTVGTKAVLHNNIIYNVNELAVPSSPGQSNWSVSGKSNWVSSGTPTSGLTGSIKGSNPGFVNLAGKNYRLTSSSPCLNKAASVSGLPDKEYYLDEKTTLQYRPRATADDLGAYEFGNSAKPVGPGGGGPSPKPDAGAPKPDAGAPKPDAGAPKPKPDAKVGKSDGSSSPGKHDSSPPVTKGDGPGSNGDAPPRDFGIGGHAFLGDAPILPGPSRSLVGGSGCSFRGVRSDRARAPVALLLLSILVLIWRRRPPV